MATDWWANQIGVASAASTPAGAVPQYGLAMDVAMAPWPDAGSFNKWAADQAKRTRATQVAAAQAEKDDEGWFQRGLGFAGDVVTNVLGALHEPAFLSDKRGEELYESRQKKGAQALADIGSAPGVKQAYQAYDFATNVLETPFIVGTTKNQNGEQWWAFQRDSWSQAWKLAEDRTPGQALTDFIITQVDGSVSNRDLDRLRRTNSLYGMTSFAGDLAIGFKLDPTVIAAKGLGEARSIVKGTLPREGQGPATIAAEALRSARGEGRYSGANPLGYYGSWRGEMVARNFADVRRAAQEMSFTDFAHMGMFRRNAVAGPQAALAFKLAAADDEMWDLTKRAVLADPNAWREIRAIKESVPDALAKYAGADARTWVDALEATKGAYKKMDSEVADLENLIAKREAQGAPTSNAGFFEFYNKELHADLAKRQADRDEINRVLESYDDYGTWLEAVPTFDNPRVSIEQVRARPATLDFLSRRTYQKSLYGKVHTVQEISKAGWLKEANPIDFHRVESGTESIRRQFEQMQHYWNYVVPDELDDVLTRFTTAMVRDDKRGAYLIAKEIEDVHLVNAMSEHYGLAPDTLRAFMDATKFKQNEMANALVSGQGAVYSTAPGLLDQGAQLIERKNGKVTIRLTDGDKAEDITVPEAALDSMLPVDPTQTPNYYSPQNHYQLKRAVERNSELFQELDTHVRNFGRKASATTFEAIDKWGTAWNQFWKPLQLFRLAWPQRVLMDEGLRGLAMLGVQTGFRTYGSALVHASLNAVLDHGPAALVKRKNVKIGPGPLADEITGRKMDTAAYETATADAPMVPSYFTPRPTKKRRELMGHMVDEMDMLRRFNMRAASLDRLYDRQLKTVNHNLIMGKVDKNVPATGKNIQRDVGAGIGQIAYRLPINERLREFVNAPYATDAPPSRGVFDIDGKPVKSGYAVPIVTKELRKSPAEMRMSTGVHTEHPFQHDLNEFLMANKDLLSSGGYRVMFESERQAGEVPRVSVVRVFRSNEIPKAIDFGHHTGADRFINMNKGHAEYIREWGAESPIMERLTRKFVVQEERDLVPGDSPARGVPPVYHGSAEGLPDELLPREQAPMLRGNLYGQGFYTTMDSELAASYSPGGIEDLYTLRGAKDGKRYKVFDLDKTVSEKDGNDLIRFGDEWVARKRQEFEEQAATHDRDGLSFNASAARGAADDLRDNWEMLKRDIETGRGFRPWRALFENNSPWSDDPGRVDTLLTAFLEEKRGAGALTHVGGVFTGGKRHQVYIWLKPEELNVRPAYDKTGRWYALEDWFDNPDSLDELFPQYEARLAELRAIPEEARTPAERGNIRALEAAMSGPRTLRNEVPESRIHRTGPKPAAAQRERDAQASGELRAQERSVEDIDAETFADFNFEIDSIHDRFVKRLLRRREFGRGYAQWKSRDGETITGKAALEAEGEVYVHLMSGAPAYARLTDSYKRTLSQSRSRAVGYKRIQPPETSAATLRTVAGREAAKDYYVAWADLLNDQVRNSPIWYRMLEGQTDEQIVSFLRNTSEGAKLRRNIPHKGYDPERWVSEHRQALDFYLPRRDMQTLLKERRLNPSDLRRIEDGDRPEVFGADLEMIDGGTGVGRWWGKMVEKTYHALGTVPTDLLSRQPFFKGMYDLKMRNLIRATDADQLDNELMLAYEKRAREFALRQVKRTMFDLSDDTNMTQALRFMAPFWGAQQEALVKWMNIAIDRPETVARFYVGLDSVYNTFTVVDEDGREVKGPRKASDPNTIFGYNPNDRVILQIPKSLKKIPPFDKMLDSFGSVGIAFGAANTALQGDNPLLPSLGPIVSIPADKFFNAMWDTHATQFDDNFFYRWLFPVGRPRGEGVGAVMEQMFPGWARRMQSMSEGQDSRSWANTYFSIYREMERDNRKKGLPPPTPEEVDRAAKWHFALRTMASFAAPAAMEFRPKNQFFLDQYHEMQRKFGPSQAFERFVEKFGADAARYAASSSTGFVPPTASGMAEWSEKRKLIEKYRDWSDAIISPDAWADDFSSDAYGAQFNIKLGPGTRQTIRELQDPAERIAITDERLGWLEYRKLQSALDAELFARGLTSLQQTGAEDLAEVKAMKVSELRQQLPGWADAYDTYSNTIYTRVNELRQFAFDKQFDNRPEFQGVRQYLTIRDQVTQSLDMYHAQTGGSRSLQAAENTALRQWFQGQVGQLILDNPSFGEFYNRYLDTDTLERGSGF